MIKIKHPFRLLYIIPVSFALTLLSFAYRYMWFSVETIPTERILVAFAGLLASSMFLVYEDSESRKKRDNAICTVCGKRDSSYERVKDGKCQYHITPNTT